MSYFKAVMKVFKVFLESLSSLYVNIKYRFFGGGDQKTYLFVPINGAGLGHLTRSLAIAKAVRASDPNAKIVFLTTSIGITLVHREGFLCHHLPPFSLTGEGVSTRKWNNLFFKTLVNVLKLHHPSTVVFDGSSPYLGFRSVMRSYKQLRYIWIKRESYKNNVNRGRLKKLAGLFSLVIHPTEVYSVFCENEFGSSYVNPIVLLEKEQLFTREKARKLLGLPLNETVAYIQLGAGNINGTDELESKVISLLKKKGIYTVLARSPISLKEDCGIEADKLMEGYPNSKYFNGFDFLVIAAGYNSICEAFFYGIPSIVIPNFETGTDDQVMRAKSVEPLGPFWTLENYTDDNFKIILENIYKYNGGGLTIVNGAHQAAKLLID
ncbi:MULTISPECIES: hypothetical protein [Chromohalobacter]|uniref:hypothetical protein n=1 Tax=Chromohalobacter TaxID=42054 RepID=UPI001FFD08C2|nr:MULTISPECIES: hypothetical protein [Chromohalobacter]MCK2045078.1 hypothetical protein [Chromohalobacter moromii]MCT8468064.1 hypothetical protein [Chromohalobacter canadensis]MCT8498563.1 hypothetical protein [Chromohalobacter canadensis]